MRVKVQSSSKQFVNETKIKKKKGKEKKNCKNKIKNMTYFHNEMSYNFHNTV